MDEWVGGLGGFAEVFEDVGNVGDAEDVGKGVDYPDDAGIEPLAGDGGEEVAQKGVGFRQQAGGFAAVEGFGGGVVQAGGKHAVSEGLGVEVGKGFFVQIVQQVFVETLQVVFQLAGFVAFGVLFEGFGYHVSHHAGFGGHHAGEGGGGIDGLAGIASEVFYQAGKFGKLLGMGLDLPHQGIGKADVGDEFAFAVELEIEVVGDDEVVEGAAVAVELLLQGFVAQVEVDVFGFDVADGQVVAGDDVVGRAAGDALGFVGNLALRHQLGKQFLQGGAVAVFGGIACGVEFLAFGKIGGNGHGGAFLVDGYWDGEAA